MISCSSLSNSLIDSGSVWDKLSQRGVMFRFLFKKYFATVLIHISDRLLLHIWSRGGEPFYYKSKVKFYILHEPYKLLNVYVTLTSLLM